MHVRRASNLVRVKPQCRFEMSQKQLTEMFLFSGEGLVGQKVVVLCRLITVHCLNVLGQVWKRL